MPRASLTDAEIVYDAERPERFRSGRFVLGAALGAQDTGTTLYELPPGQAVSPYHYEYTEEEWVLVLEGRPTLRTPEGTEQLAPLDVAFFPKGPEGAHLIRNDTDETVRVLMWANVVAPGAVAYPDSDKVSVYTGVQDERWTLLRSTPRIDYFHGET